MLPQSSHAVAFTRLLNDTANEHSLIEMCNDARSQHHSAGTVGQ